MKDFFLILIGGICSALGGCVAGCLAIWYQAKKTRQIRMEEKTADVQFEAQRKGLVLIRKLRTSLNKREHDDARKFYCDNGFWFSENWMFLPEGFVKGWKSIGLKLHDLSLIEQGEKETQDEEKKDKYIKEAVDLGALLPKLAVEAENALRKEMGLKEAE
jgi:hypothetical protein